MAQTQTAIELTTKPVGADQQPSESQGDVLERPNQTLRKGPTAIIFTSVTAVTGISSLLAGLVTVALPRIVHDLDIPTSLLLW
jgi:hypothetical protein